MKIQTLNEKKLVLFQENEKRLYNIIVGQIDPLINDNYFSLSTTIKIPVSVYPIFVSFFIFLFFLDCSKR